MATEIITRAQARAQGLKRYFTGRPCKNGHIAERQVSSITCMECDRIKRRDAWAVRDRDATREKRKVWEAKNRDKLAAYSLSYGRRPEVKAKYKAWYEANRDQILAARALTYPSRRASNIASAKAWAEANPEKAREHFRLARRRRRARALDAGGSHTAADLAEILEAQGHRCAYCRVNLRRIKKHVDHIVPLALGGSNGRANLQYLCAPCNQSKGARDPIDHAKSLGLLI